MWNDLLSLLLSQLRISFALLQTTAEFPVVLTRISDCLSQVTDLQQNATKMAASVADSSNIIRSLIVQAEDHRLLQQM